MLKLVIKRVKMCLKCDETKNKIIASRPPTFAFHMYYKRNKKRSNQQMIDLLDVVFLFDFGAFGVTYTLAIAAATSS